MTDAEGSNPGSTGRGFSAQAGALMLAAGSAAFGLMAYFVSLAKAAGATTPTILALRFGIAAVCLWVVVLARGTKLPRGWVLWATMAMGAVCYFGEAALYFHGLSYASSGTIALLLYTYPALVAIISRVFLKERLGPTRLTALMLAMAGTLITVSGEVSGSTLGIVLGLGCAVTYAVYILAGAHLPKDVDPLGTATIVITSTAVSCCVYALAMGWRSPGTATGWVGIGGLAVVCTVFAITCVLAGLTRVGSVRAGTIATIEPLATVIAGAALLGEPLGWKPCVGGALIVAGAIISAREKASETMNDELSIATGRTTQGNDGQS